MPRFRSQLLIGIGLIAGTWSVHRLFSINGDDASAKNDAPASELSGQLAAQATSSDTRLDPASRMIDRLQPPASPETPSLRSTVASSQEDSIVRVWPVQPAAMESIVLSALASIPGVNITSIASSECSTTVCEIRYVTTNLTPPIIAGDSEFIETFRAPPYSAYFGMEGRRLDSATSEITLTLTSHPPGPPTPEELAEQRRQDLARTLRFAENALPSTSHDAAPVVFGRRNGVEEVVENVCSYDCPEDTQRMIYLRVPDGRSCEQVDGTERTITALTQAEGFVERTFCVPNALITDD